MEPLLIGGISLAVLILVLVAAYLLFYKEQSFEDALANQKSFSDILIQTKSASGKTGLKHRKKTRKERTKSEGESEKIVTKQSDLVLEASENSDSSTLPKSLADEAASLFETLPEKPAVAESSEEEKPVHKQKKKSRDRRKPDHSRDAVESPLPKEQEPDKRVVKEVLVQESFVKINEEQDLEGLPPMVEEEPVLPKDEATLPTGSSGKKAKKSKGQKDKPPTAAPLGLKSLIEALETANLSHDEIQKLVDVLLDKQKSAEEWKKSGGKLDPMVVLKKQLSDKDAEYKEEHARAESLAVKVKEQREEFTQGLAKQKKHESEAAQRIESLEKENQALQLRMTASHQNNALEREKLVATLEMYKKNHGPTDPPSGGDLIKNLNNQNAELNTRISALETEIKSRKENEAMLMQKNEQANDKVKNLDVLKNNLSQQLMEAVKSKSESQQKLELAKKGAEAAQSEKSNAIQHAGTLQSQLDEERSKKSELEKMFKALEVKLKDTSDKHVQEKEMLAQQLEAASGKKAEAETAKLQKQSEDATRQLDELKAKLAQSEEEHEKTKQSLVGREEQLNKHEGEISSLKSTNSSKDEEIDLLRRTITQHESEIVVMKNNMAQELHSAPPEVDDTKVKSLEEEIEKLNLQLNERKEQIATWEKSIETMKAKNNELREKNWKAMDALSASEKQHKIDIGKAVSSVKEENERNRQALYIEFKEFLCRIHPTLSIDKDLSYEDFLNKYENDTEEFRSPKSESNDSKVEELQEQLKNYMKQNEELEAQCQEHKTNLDNKVNELNEVSKRNEELDNNCNKYKSLLGSTENMLHELEDNVEKEIASLKVTVESKDAELGQTNSSLNEFKEKLEKALEDTRSKDEKIASLQDELASKASLGDKESLELQQMSLTMSELKETLKNKDEHAKTKDDKITSLEKDVSNKDTELKKANSAVAEFKESAQKASDESKSKDGKINSLQLELSTLKTAAATASDESKNENKKLSEQVEAFKEKEKSLRDELEAAKKEAQLRAEEDKSPELEKYKNEASDAAKVNTALRKELEEVRMQNTGSKSPKKKHDKENETKIKTLEEKLAIAAKKESDLQAKIAHLEDSTSTHSLDEDNASPDGKDKKKKRGFSLMGSKSSKYETKYRDISEKYEQVKSENDEKTSRIAELEAKLDNSEKALQTQEQKVKELKAQVGGLANGGVQTNDKPLNESQMKQMVEAMTDGDPTGAV